MTHFFNRLHFGIFSCHQHSYLLRNNKNVFFLEEHLKTSESILQQIPASFDICIKQQRVEILAIREIHLFYLFLFCIY